MQALAAALVDRGVGKGDRVVIYMPMIPQAAFAMLACARIGAIHSVVFGGFAANELATRLNDAKPKAIISASCGIEPGRTIAYKPLLDEAIDIAEHKPQACIIFQREQLVCDLIEGRDADYAAVVKEAIDAGREVPCTACCCDRPALHPLYVRYHRSAQGGCPRQWRSHGRAQLEHGISLWHQAR